MLSAIAINTIDAIYAIAWFRLYGVLGEGEDFSQI